MLVLWQFEECENSQPVRKLMTQLGLDYVTVNAPATEPEKDEVMERLFGSNKTPAFWDTRTGVLLQDQDAICRYLECKYAEEVPRD